MTAKKLTFLFAALTLVLMSARQRPVHVFMAGDSTMANKVFYKTFAQLKNSLYICRRKIRKGDYKYVYQILFLYSEVNAVSNLIKKQTQSSVS